MGVVRFGEHLVLRVVAVAALLAAVLAGGQQGLALTVGMTATVLVATGVMAASVLGSVLVPSSAGPGGGAARELGTLLPWPRQCEPDAAGGARPRAPGVRDRALI